jgi:uncharacterized protein (TIGR03435 family)
MNGLFLFAPNASHGQAPPSLEFEVASGRARTIPNASAASVYHSSKLVMAAYSVQRDQIKGPDWAATDDIREAARTDTSVKVPPGATKEEAATMPQKPVGVSP